MRNAEPSIRSSWRDRLLLLGASVALFMNIDLIVGALPVHIAQSGGGEREVGILTGIFAGGTVAARPILAAAATRRGLRAILLLSAISASVVPGLYALAPTTFWIGGVRLLHAIVPAGLLMTVPLILSDLSLPQERGRVLGLYGVASGLSLLVAPALGVWLVRFGGIAWVVATGLFIAMMAVGAILIARTAPENASTPPMQAPSPVANENGKAEGITEDQTGGQTLPAADAVLLRQRTRYWLLLLLNLLSTYAFGTALSFSTLHGIQLGIANPGIFFTAFSLGTMLTRYYGGHIADHYGTRWSVPLSLLTLTGGLVTAAFATGAIAFTAGAALVGAGFGAVQTLYWTEFVNLNTSGRTTASAWFTNAFDIGIMIGSFVGGWVAGLGGFVATYALAALLSLGGLPFWFLYLRNPQAPVSKASTRQSRRS